MKTWRYVIESDRKGKIRETSKRYKSIKIEKAYYVKETPSEEQSDFRNSLTNVVIIILMGISLICLFILLAALVAGSDIYIYNQNVSIFTADLLATSSLCLMILQFKPVQEFVNNKLKLPKIGNLIFSLIVAFGGSFIPAYIFLNIGLTPNISNVISLVCLYVSTFIHIKDQLQLKCMKPNKT